MQPSHAPNEQTTQALSQPSLHVALSSAIALASDSYANGDYPKAIAELTGLERMYGVALKELSLMPTQNRADAAQFALLSYITARAQWEAGDLKAAQERLQDSDAILAEFQDRLKQKSVAPVRLLLRVEMELLKLDAGESGAAVSERAYQELSTHTDPTSVLLLTQASLLNDILRLRLAIRASNYDETKRQSVITGESIEDYHGSDISVRANALFYIASRRAQEARVDAAFAMKDYNEALGLTSALDPGGINLPAEHVVIPWPDGDGGFSAHPINSDCHDDSRRLRAKVNELKAWKLLDRGAPFTETAFFEFALKLFEKVQPGLVQPLRPLLTIYPRGLNDQQQSALSFATHQAVLGGYKYLVSPILEWLKSKDSQAQAAAIIQRGLTEQR